MTRSMVRSRASSAASAPPSHRLTPVTRTTAGGTSVSSLLVATLHAGLLEQLAVLLLRHPLAPLLDDRTHVLLPTSWPRGTDRRGGTGRHASVDQLVCDGSGRGRGVARDPSLPGVPAATLAREPGRGRSHHPRGSGGLPAGPA